MKKVTFASLMVFLFTLHALASLSDQAIFIGNTNNENTPNGCTAANLVDGWILVTAAHCIGTHPNIAYYGNDIQNPKPSEVVRIAKVFAYPGYISGNYSPANAANDIGFVLLESPVPSVGNAPIARSQISLPAGSRLEAFGYHGGLKNSKRMSSIDKESGALAVNCSNCANGDSGGPVYYNGSLLGVMSERSNQPGKFYVAPISQKHIDWLYSQLKP